MLCGLSCKRVHCNVPCSRALCCCIMNCHLAQCLQRKSWHQSSRMLLGGKSIPVANVCVNSSHSLLVQVAGNFHFAPGKSFQQGSVHVHDLVPFRDTQFDTSHVIDKLSFGVEYPGMTNPLDKTTISKSNTRNPAGRPGAYQYFLKVQCWLMWHLSLLCRLCHMCICLFSLWCLCCCSPVSARLCNCSAYPFWISRRRALPK